MPTAGSVFPFTPLFFAAFAGAFAWYWWAVVAGRVTLGLPKILVLGLFFRLLLLPMPACDDMARFIWEGRVAAAGEDPYRLSPADATLAPLRDGNWSRINHKDIPAVYPPLALGLFTALAAAGPSPILFKSAFILLDVVAFLVLAFAFRTAPAPGGGGPPPGPGGAPPRQGNAPVTRLAVEAAPAAAYFLNPLLIFAVAGEGHFESLPLLLCLLFLAALRRGRGPEAAAWLALAALAKVSAIVLLPVLALAFPWRRGTALALAAAAPLPIALLWTGSGETLARFASAFRYNDAVPYLLRAASGGWLPEPGQRALSLLLFLAAAALALRRLRRAGPERQALACMGLLLAFSPTLHPWYALWILPFAALSGSRPWLLFTGTAAAGYGAYAAAQATGRFREVAWLRLPEFLPPLLLAAWTRRPAAGRLWRPGGRAAVARETRE